ncbi:transcriptional regulator, XRE family [Methylocella silvestris BL2]|uniref:Transcriptional regulator, XRE family n=1 Tax=Methylocella silvestris (strain DSM 15510 / CIP 108128 / LMG 27833 / NCIMB 13906 / BL2) TaxID=395965 RepID=B8ELL5_METSB|nr:helix-turn-helix transcriptional regulator [Methylocella silvestris]ACK50009.1 transcriptional regulator, XRE family [Methylocella silvestris BL2]
MTGPQIIKTPGGEELVVLPRAEYDALVAAAAEAAEDEADAAIYDSRTADLTAGRDARLPPEVSTALLRGESLLKALRKWRGMTQIDLAILADLGQGYLSDLEAGRRRGSRETLHKIAEKLNIEPAWLIGAGDKSCGE